MTTITPHQTHELLKQKEESFLLLDCRTPEEYEVARIDGSRLVPMQEIPQRLEELEPHKEQPIVVYCHAGMRSQRVTDYLLQQGFTDVRSMVGGIDRWSVEIDPQIPRY